MALSSYIEKGWGSYNELVNLSMKDFIEIHIAIESKQQEDQIQKSINGR